MGLYYPGINLVTFTDPTTFYFFAHKFIYLMSFMQVSKTWYSFDENSDTNIYDSCETGK